jgi:hypothetical protein
MHPALRQFRCANRSVLLSGLLRILRTERVRATGLFPLCDEVRRHRDLRVRKVWRRAAADAAVAGRIVSRFRSSHHCAAHSFANFGIKGTLAIYDSSAVFGFEVPKQTRSYNDRNFKSTALDCRTGIDRPDTRIHGGSP